MSIQHLKLVLSNGRLIHLQLVLGPSFVHGNVAADRLAFLGHRNYDPHLMPLSFSCIHYIAQNTCTKLSRAAWFNDHAKESTIYLLDSNLNSKRITRFSRKFDTLLRRLRLDVAYTKKHFFSNSTFLISWLWVWAYGKRSPTCAPSLLSFLQATTTNFCYVSVASTAILWLW